jgi:uncharacterized protein YjbJ (UPF0337 family)
VRLNQRRRRLCSLHTQTRAPITTFVCPPRITHPPALRVDSGTGQLALLPLQASRGSSLGDAKSSLGDAKSLLGDAKSSLGDAESSLGDAKSSLGDAKSSLGDAKSLLGDAKSSLGDAESSLGDAKSSLGDVQDREASSRAGSPHL